MYMYIMSVILYFFSCWKVLIFIGHFKCKHFKNIRIIYWIQLNLFLNIEYIFIKSTNVIIILTKIFNFIQICIFHRKLKETNSLVKLYKMYLLFLELMIFLLVLQEMIHEVKLFYCINASFVFLINQL